MQRVKSFFFYRSFGFFVTFFGYFLQKKPYLILAFPSILLVSLSSMLKISFGEPLSTELEGCLKFL